MALGGGGNILGLIFKIGQKGGAETAAEIKVLRKEFETHLGAIKNSGKDAFLSLGNSAGFSTSQLAGLAGGLPLVAGALAAVGAAAVGVGAALFELTKKTADYGEEVWRAHEKTSLSVETISALKVAGDQVGVSLNTLSTGFVRFTNNLALAAAGNKKFTSEFAQLGVKSFKNTDAALSEFLTHFARLRTDQERTLAASQVFGVRMGASFVGMFNHIGGNMEAFKAKLRDLGLLLDTEQARESYEFTILYKQLMQQFGALTRTIGFEVMPVFMQMFTDTSKTLQENQSHWKHWGEYIAALLIATEAVVIGFGRALQQAFTGSWVDAMTNLSGYIIEARNQIEKEVALIKGEHHGPAENEQPQIDFALPGKTAKAKKDNQPKKDAEAELDVLKKDASDRQLVYQQETEKLKHQYDTRLIDIAAFIAAEKAANDKRQDDLIVNINDQQTALDAAHAKGLIKEDEYLKKNAELKKETDKIVLDHDKEQDRIETEDYKTRLAALEKHNQNILELDKKDAEIRLAEIKDAEDRNTMVHSDAAKERIDIELGLLIKQREFLRAELAVAHEGSEEYKGIQQKLAILDKEVTLSDAESKRTIRDARQQDINDLKKVTAEKAALITKVAALEKQADDAYIQRSFEQRRVDLDQLDAKHGLNAKLIEQFRMLTQDEIDYAHRRVMAEIDAQQAEAHATDVGNRNRLEIEKRFNKLREQENQRFHKAVKAAEDKAAKDTTAATAMGKAMLELKKVGESVLNGLAQGIGNMVQQWVLMGNAAEISMKKMVAAVLAGVAQQAAVQAIMELGYAFAALAKAIFGDPLAGEEATLHFQSAAIFGSLAVGAGLIGRAVAGNSFQQQSGGASTASVGGSGGATTGTGTTAPVVSDISRLRGGAPSSAQPIVHVIVEAKLDHGIIATAVAKNFERGGPGPNLRQLILRDGVKIS